MPRQDFKDLVCVCCQVVLPDKERADKDDIIFLHEDHAAGDETLAQQRGEPHQRMAFHCLMRGIGAPARPRGRFKWGSAYNCRICRPGNEQETR